MSRRLLACLILVLVVALGTPVSGTAADPSPAVTPGPSPILIDPLDPRAGEAASGVGAPLLALLAVVGLGVLAATGTAVYVLAFRRR